MENYHMLVGAKKLELQQKLIEVVEQHPIIYDPVCQQHKNMTAVNNAWEEICDYVGADARACKTIWARLRASYRYYKRRTMPRSGRMAMPIKKWAFAESMSFLDGFSQGRDQLYNTSQNRAERISDEGTAICDPILDSTRLSRISHTPLRDIENYDKELSSRFAFHQPSTPNEYMRSWQDEPSQSQRGPSSSEGEAGFAASQHASTPSQHRSTSCQRGPSGSQRDPDASPVTTVSLESPNGSPRLSLLDNTFNVALELMQKSNKALRNIANASEGIDFNDRFFQMIATGVRRLPREEQSRIYSMFFFEVLNTFKRLEIPFNWN